jgi:hypothetical protein
MAANFRIEHDMNAAFVGPVQNRPPRQVGPDRRQQKGRHIMAGCFVRKGDRPATEVGQGGKCVAVAPRNE